MKMENFIDLLQKSENKLLVSEADSITEWSKLKHNKEGLELFLNNNLSEVTFEDSKKNKKTVIVSSNTTLIKMFALRENSKYKENSVNLSKLKSTGIHTKSQVSVLSWDFINSKYCTITLNNWYLGRWITINENNIVLLNDVMRDLLKKNKNTIEKKDNKNKKKKEI